MSLQFEIVQGGSTVPAGIFKMAFQTVEPTSHDEFGPGLKFCFEVIDGEHAGEQATRITSDKPSPKNSAGRMITGIVGRSISPGENIDLAFYVGKKYLVQVEDAKGGGTRIATVMPTESTN